MEERKYQRITVRMEEGWVHIVTDEALLDFLERENKRDALCLAEWIRKEYEGVMGRKLKIDRDSLAVEILIHAYMDKIADTLEEQAEEIPQPVRGALEKVCDSVQRHTEVIDCGERSVDSNRLIFDGLSAFHELIYRILE